MALPNFIIAGFPKCGSTSLYYYLAEHPEIFMPKQKELHYFTYRFLSKMDKGTKDAEVNKFHISTFNAYQNCYRQVRNELAIGDASPSYINYPDCFDEIKEKLGETKAIVLVRDPIKRAFSNYLHLVREKRETLEFHAALQIENQRRKENYSDFWYYKFNSTYYQKIKELKMEFKDVFIVTSEELASDTQTTLKKIYSFLNVNDDFLPKSINRRYNEGGKFKSNLLTKLILEQNVLRSFVKRNFSITPQMKHLKHSLLERYKEPIPKIDEKAEAYLLDFFADDVKKLENDFGIQTQYWNSKFH